MKLERIGIGTKRMGILLCTSLKSTISDWIGAGTGLVAFQHCACVCLCVRGTCQRVTLVCVWLSAFALLLLLLVGGFRLCLRRGPTVNAVYLFKKL